jgi:carbon-monoxide dehydrogenase catalytic subunit
MKPSLIQAAKDAGATGINLVACAVPVPRCWSATPFPTWEISCPPKPILVTGAVDAMCVDIQCIKQGLVSVADCYDTPLITTNPGPISKVPPISNLTSMIPRHVPMTWSSKRSAGLKTARWPLRFPIFGYGVHGFSHEYINYMLGGSFRGSYTPLNDNIINGRIRGVAGVVGCTNPRIKQDWAHVELVKELIKNDVLVLQTGCSQIALAKEGLTTPEAAYSAGPGLREVCETVGMPPVLALGHVWTTAESLSPLPKWFIPVGGLGTASPIFLRPVPRRNG